MYLHVNKNCVIKNKDIIGIFILKTLNKTKEYENLKENMEIKDLSEGNPKTFILADKNKGYILKLKSNTIEKRMIEREKKNGKV